jgi:hypothetical protein
MQTAKDHQILAFALRTHATLLTLDSGLNANYASLEAFTRAFRKAFGISPGLYRRIGVTHTHLHTANGIHHYSGTDETKGAGQFMDLSDIFSGQGILVCTASSHLGGKAYRIWAWRWKDLAARRNT